LSQQLELTAAAVGGVLVAFALIAIWRVVEPGAGLMGTGLPFLVGPLTALLILTAKSIERRRAPALGDARSFLVDAIVAWVALLGFTFVLGLLVSFVAKP
jgi:hypothetical protein